MATSRTSRRRAVGQRARGKRRVADHDTPDEATLRRAVRGRVLDLPPTDALTELRHRRAARLTSLLAGVAADPEQSVALRAMAVQALGEESKQAHRRALHELLGCGEGEVERRVVEAMGRIGGSEELEALRAFRTGDPVLKRTSDTAKTLLSYRTGGRGNRLPLPDERDVLVLGNLPRAPIRAAALATVELEQQAGVFKRELPGMRLAPAAYALTCGKLRYALLFNRDVVRGDAAAHLGRSSAVLGALLRLDDATGEYHLDAYLLTHPGPGATARLFLLRPSGHVCHHGQLRLGKQATGFELSAINGRHTRPIHLAGHLVYRTLDLQLETAEVATAKAPEQPPPRAPRLIPPGR